MDLHQPNAHEVTQTASRSKSSSPASGLRSQRIGGVHGSCEALGSFFRGGDLLCPLAFGMPSAGGDKECPVDYSHLSIMSYTLGGEDLPGGQECGFDGMGFATTNTEVAYGLKSKVKMRLPIFVSAVGSSDVAKTNWDHCAAGAGVTGISLVCGENVCGLDPDLELDSNGRVVRSPEMSRRVEVYKRWHDGYGELIVRVNVEDTRLGVAEYVVGELGVETVEFKWGQGTGCTDEDAHVSSIECAIELQKRGYLITPNPSEAENQAAFRDGAFKYFRRYSRRGFIDHAGFMKEVDRVRKLGARRVTLSIGLYPMAELAMAIKWASEARLDLLTIDGAVGGTGMNSWTMTEEVAPSALQLQSMIYELCEKLAAKGSFVPDIAIGGGFSTEGHVFKVIAMGAPYVKTVCMGSDKMVSGMIDKNVGPWLREGPDVLSEIFCELGVGKEEAFIAYESLVDGYGKVAVENMPLGAVAMYCFANGLRTGLQRLMVHSRNSCVRSIGRKDVVALTEEASRVSGIPYVMAGHCNEAM